MIKLSITLPRRIHAAARIDAIRHSCSLGSYLADIIETEAEAAAGMPDVNPTSSKEGVRPSVMLPDKVYSAVCACAEAAGATVPALASAWVVSRCMRNKKRAA